MLNDSKVEANIPAADLQRARTFYADTLGLSPVQDMGPNLVYETAGGTRFNIYETSYAGQAGHINTDSGYGPWPEGSMAFAQFLSRL